MSNIREELTIKGYKFIASFEEYEDAATLYENDKKDVEIIKIQDPVLPVEVFEVWVKTNKNV
jgi:hypothetical protein